MNIVTKRRLAGLGAAALSVAAFAAPAQAGIGAAADHRGLLTERYGFFPEYYKDSNNTSLQLCIDLAPTCGAVALPHAGPISFPGNFPDEMFYWSGDATVGTGISLTLAQEATYGGTDGSQAVFGRVRVTDTDTELTTGEWYRFTTPYGQFDRQAGAKRQVFTQDVGCPATGCAPVGGDFGAAAFGDVGASDVGPAFLTSNDPATPAGFVGDGATPATVTGSEFTPADATINAPDPCDPVVDPTCTPATPDPDTGLPANYFRVDHITGDGGTIIGNVGRTTQFVIVGKLADDPAQPYLQATSPDAGSQPIGDGAKSLTLTVRDGGSGDLKLADVTVDANPDFTVTGGTCANDTVKPAGRTQAPTAPDTTCTVVVAFDPVTAGGKVATLHIAEQGAAGTIHDIALTGVGTKPVLATDQGGLSFGVQAVGTTAPTLTATVRNTGNAPLLVNGAVLSGAQAGDYGIIANSCANATLAPNATCTVDVNFTPSATSVRNASLDITSAAGSKSLSLSGIGSATPVGPNTIIIQQTIGGAAAGAAAGGGDAAPAGGGGSSATLPKLTLKRLGMAKRIKFATARTQGIRLHMEITPGTEVVKIDVYRRGGGKLKLISSGFKAPGKTGLYTVRQSHAALRKLLRRGIYEVHVTPGRSKTDLGTMSKFAFTVV